MRRPRSHPGEEPVFRGDPALVEITQVGASSGYYKANQIVWDSTTGDWTTGSRLWDGIQNPELLDIYERQGLPIGTRGRARLLSGQWIFEPMQIGVFPVDLTQTGGSAGDKTTQCSFTYTVSDLDGNPLLTAVDPISTPHRCTRPAIGALLAAAYGTATWIPDGSGGFDLVLLSISETLDMVGCP